MVRTYAFCVGCALVSRLASSAYRISLILPEGVESAAARQFANFTHRCQAPFGPSAGVWLYKRHFFLVWWHDLRGTFALLNTSCFLRVQKAWQSAGLRQHICILGFLYPNDGSVRFGGFGKGLCACWSELLFQKRAAFCLSHKRQSYIFILFP